MSTCTHTDQDGHETVHLASDLGDFAEAYYECDQCGAELTEEERDALKLPPASEAWNEAEQDRADQQAYYERTRGSG